MDIFKCAIAFFSLAKEKKLYRNETYSTLSHAVYDLYNSQQSLFLLRFESDWNPLYLSGCVWVCVCSLPFCFYVGIGKQISNAKWCFQFTLVFLATHNFDNDWRPKHVKSFLVSFYFSLCWQILSLYVFIRVDWGDACDHKEIEYGLTKY